jgi:polysaccharide biosynthesis protein PslH
MNRRKILVVSPFSILPPHFGSSERTYNLARGLAKFYDVLLLHTDYSQVKVPPTQTEIPGVRICKVGPSRRYAQLFNPFLLFKGLQLIRSEKPALLISGHLWAGLHVMILHCLTGIPYVLDEHNAEYVRWQRMKRASAGVVTWAERWCCKMAMAVLCVSDIDRRLLSDLGLPREKIFVVPNGVDLDQYHPDPAARRLARGELGLADDSPLVLFFGKLDYQPNAEAVDIIVQEIMPRVLAQNPGVRFVVCGYRPPVERYAQAQLVFTGVVPRIQDYINAADSVIVPLISGGGTKFKIIQAIACGRRVITTPTGAEGINPAGPWMRVTDNWDEFAAWVLRDLMEPPPVLEETWQRFCSAYAWQQMVEQARQVISACLEGSK